MNCSERESDTSQPRNYSCVRACVCVCVCVCMCVCVSMYVRMYICMIVCNHVCKYACMYACIYASIHPSIHPSINPSVYIYFKKRKHFIKHLLVETLYLLWFCFHEVTTYVEEMHVPIPFFRCFRAFFLSFFLALFVSFFRQFLYYPTF